jgi:hypothetical protein
MGRRPIRLVDKDWGQELSDALLADCSELRIISPFIKWRALKPLLSHPPGKVRVITRFNPPDFAVGVSDVESLQMLLDEGARVRGIRKLHAKLYLFGDSCAIITSANLTRSALYSNHEFGMVVEDTKVIKTCHKYFNDLWRRGKIDLDQELVDYLSEIVSHHRETGGRPSNLSGLRGDLGIDAGDAGQPLVLTSVAATDAPQSFVKLLGKSDNRKPLDFAIIDEIKRAGCHWALTYPESKCPISVSDDAVMFIARLTKKPVDIRIFGRAIGMRYRGNGDVATPAEINFRPFKADYPRYIRVHNAEFVAGTMANGVSLYKMMKELGEKSFTSTQENAALGQGNTNPRLAYRQQPHVQLSADGFNWLNDRLQEAFITHGKIAKDTLDQLDWPIDTNTEETTTLSFEEGKTEVDTVEQSEISSTTNRGHTASKKSFLGRIANKYKITLSRDGEWFESKPIGYRFVVSASAPSKNKNKNSKIKYNINKYWFGYNTNHMEYLKNAKHGFFVVVCKDNKMAFSIPASDMNKLAKQMLTSPPNGKGKFFNYHVYIRQDGDRHFIFTHRDKGEFDINKFSI